MDKSIEVEVSTRKKRSRILLISGIAICLVLGIWLMRTLLKPSLNTSEIVTSAVEVGSIENTINATGEVLPEFEEILSSPIRLPSRRFYLNPAKKSPKDSPSFDWINRPHSLNLND